MQDFCLKVSLKRAEGFTVGDSEMVNLGEILSSLESARKPKIEFTVKATNGISKSGQKLGVFSGSFNPPTVAHLRLCEHAQKHLELDEILLLLAIMNVDKTRFDFSLEERVNMMTAIAGERDSWSVALCSHGRFVEKSEAVAEAYPSDTEIWFIVGHDTFVRIFEPRFYLDIPMNVALQKFFKIARLAVFPRGNVGEEAVRDFIGRQQVKPFSDRIAVLPTEPSILWVSSTLARQKLRLGEKVNGLVPPTVIKFLGSSRNE